MIAAGSATSVNMFGYVEPPGVSPGDTIYFGLGSLVEIDGTSGTVPNPGIALGVPGAKGVASKTIYFGWSWGANAIWWSQDGGSTFAAMPGTTPYRPHRFKISNDASLAGGGGNVLYVTDGSPNSPANRNAWRYVSTPPKGSGLTANTWTNLPHAFAPGISVVCPDPTKLGHCAIVLAPGNTALSKDYGNTTGGYYGGAPINATGSDNGVTDPPWLAYTNQGYHSMGDAEFDSQSLRQTLALRRHRRLVHRPRRIIPPGQPGTRGRVVSTLLPFNESSKPQSPTAGYCSPARIVRSLL